MVESLLNKLKNLITSCVDWSCNINAPIFVNLVSRYFASELQQRRPHRSRVDRCGRLRGQGKRHRTPFRKFSLHSIIFVGGRRQICQIARHFWNSLLRISFFNNFFINYVDRLENFTERWLLKWLRFFYFVLFGFFIWYISIT